MKTIKVSEAEGAALDWLVAKCEGALAPLGNVQVIDNKRPLICVAGDPEHGGSRVYYAPSSDWAQGGPIIEREDIAFRKYHRTDSAAHGTHYARICRESGTMVGWHKTTGFQHTGPTPLVAAMRCYVSSRLGDTVEVPEVLT
jgi:hypothetical protein